MALGIGANTAMFSIVNTVLLRPLRFRDADRIVTVSSLWRKNASHGQVSAPDFHDWHDESTAFDAMAYYDSDDTSVRTGAGAEYHSLARVTPEFFRVFQVQPLLGRSFSEEEMKPGSSGAVVISYAYWQSHFAGQPTAVGQTVRVFDQATPIVGVLPPGFYFPHRTDVWFPANTLMRETTSRSGHNYLVVGLLKPGVMLQEAQAQMTAIGERLERQYPASNQGKGVYVSRLQDEMVSNVRLTLYLLLGAVGAVLLIACANMANLLLAKATNRTREIAIRAAIGASRGRIVRQLITESAVLSILAAVAALALAYWVRHAMVALAPVDVPRINETGIDPTVLLFTLALALLTSLLFGLAPALQLARIEVHETLKQGASRGTVGGTTARLRSAFVVAEVALSVVLLAGAGLLLKSFAALHDVALGFQPENVLVMRASVPASNLDTARQATGLYKDLLGKAAMIPGASAVGLTMAPPGEVHSSGGYWIDHLPGPEGLNVSGPQAVFSVVGPGTFATLGIPLKHGRDFDETDQYEAPFTAVINESLAKKSFPGQDPIGHVLFCGLDSLNPMKIVGIVGDVRQYGPAVDPRPEIYMPYRQHPLVATSLSLLARTSIPGVLEDALRRTVRELSPDVPVRFTTMDANLSENIAAPRFRAVLLAIFAGLALGLAVLGVYGVMSYMVSQSTNEIGLRMALGATRGNLLRLVLGRALVLAASGVAAGLAASFALTGLLVNFLFGIKPSDPLTFLEVSALLLLVALAASFVPAVRATRVDPLVAMRCE
jgi:predicted permease